MDVGVYFYCTNVSSAMQLYNLFSDEDIKMYRTPLSYEGCLTIEISLTDYIKYAEMYPNVTEKILKNKEYVQAIYKGKLR